MLIGPRPQFLRGRYSGLRHLGFASFGVVEQLSRFSVDNFKFSHRPVEDGHAVREGWNSIHVDGVDGVLAVQFALKDHLDALEVVVL